MLACVEAEGLSWPAWRQKHPESPSYLRGLVETWRKRFAETSRAGIRVTLTGHSGGGSFLWGYLNGGDTIPAEVDRIAFLDANYSYSDDDHHGDKLLDWLTGDPARHLVVLAYDDRNITLNGKPVVGPTGGTYRATERMRDTFGKRFPLTLLDGEKTATRDATANPILRYEGMNGQFLFVVPTNPANKILHTALVGDMNGYLMAMTYGTPEATQWGNFGGPRAYSRWIEPLNAPTDKTATKPTVVSDTPVAMKIPPRPKTAPGGAALMARVAALPVIERENILVQQILNGNLPNFLRSFKTVRVRITDAHGLRHHAEFRVMPDYLAVGSDHDFVRVPLTPMSARRIGDAFGCTLPTRKMVDTIYAQATIKLEPHPMTEEREAIPTFVEHNRIIEQQRTEWQARQTETTSSTTAEAEIGTEPFAKSGTLSPSESISKSTADLTLLIAGIKKDVVQTPLLLTRPDRVAIYGWHKLDGKPIQPLTTIHRNTYVDYSHGIRLILRTLTIDGKPTTIEAVLQNPDLRDLLSDEPGTPHNAL